MDEKAMEQMNSERIRRIDEASRKLLSNDLDGAKSDLAWMEISSKLAAAGQKKSHVLLPIILTGIVCILLVGFAWTIRRPWVQVSVEVVTANVSMTLSKDWIARHSFASDKVFINNLMEISAPGLNLSKKSDPGKEQMSLELKGKDIIISKLTLAADSEIELTLQGDIFKLFVKGSSMSGEFFVRQAAVSLDAGDETIERDADFEVPETISFKTAKTIADPVRLEFIPKGDWQARSLQVQEIDFSEEITPGSGISESALISGKIALPQIKYSEDLRGGDSLIIKNIKKFRRLEISKGDKGIKVFFEGAVSKIFSGPKGFEKNLTPNWLEYLYHQERLTVFWGASVFLFGLLWKVRNTIFG
jgi:hypothetical protein